MAAGMAYRLSQEMQKVERVESRVGYVERPRDPRVEKRFLLQCLGDAPFLSRHVGVLAGRAPAIGEFRWVSRRRDKQAAGVLDGLWDDPAQRCILSRAIARGNRIRDHVATAGMQQTVVSAGCPLAEIALLKDNDLQAAQTGIPGDAKTRGATTDDQQLSRYGRIWHG